MKIRVLILKPPSGGIFLSLLISVSVMGLAGLVAPASARAIQRPFDPSGYFYPKDGVLDDIDHITLMRNYQEGDDREPPGVYTTKGEVFKFISLNTSPTPDLGKILLKFKTAKMNGICYTFWGEFHNSHIYEIYVTDPNEIAASGTLQTFKNGKVTSEIRVQLTYSASLRNRVADVNARYPSGKTDLIYATSKGDLARVRDLLARGAKVNARGPHGSTALEYAVRRFRASEERMIEVLIAAGANVNLANESGDTPLMEATYSGGRLVELLLGAGAEVNARSKDGRTALIHAVQALGVGLGSIEDVKALIREGAEVNAQDALGRTALSIATADHSQEAIDLLKQAGAK